MKIWEKKTVLGKLNYCRFVFKFNQNFKLNYHAPLQQNIQRSYNRSSPLKQTKCKWPPNTAHSRIQYNATVLPLRAVLSCKFHKNPFSENPVMREFVDKISSPFWLYLVRKFINIMFETHQNKDKSFGCNSQTSKKKILLLKQNNHSIFISENDKLIPLLLFTPTALRVMDCFSFTWHRT